MVTKTLEGDAKQSKQLSIRLLVALSYFKLSFKTSRLITERASLVLNTVWEFFYLNFQLNLYLHIAYLTP